MRDLTTWRLRKKGDSDDDKQDRLQEGGCQVSISSSNMYILSDLMTKLGHPTAVKFMISGKRLAILPAVENGPNAYAVTGNNQVSVPWLPRELELRQMPQGRFDAHKESGMWVIDFGN